MLHRSNSILQLCCHPQNIIPQILREAKETTEATEKNLQLVQKQQYKKQLHFETLFDDYHGKW